MILYENVVSFLSRNFMSLFLSFSEHQNYFGVDENLGPVAISVRREKLDDGKDKEGSQYNYRITFRTSQVKTERMFVTIVNFSGSVVSN